MGRLKLSAAEEALSAWANPQPHDVVKDPPASGALPGLANLGNTCFANSVLQCLLNTPGWFPEACLAFGQFEESSHSKKAALGRSFQRLACEYGSKENGSLSRSNASLKNLKDAIAAIDPQYAGCQQQDAYEFLGCLLEGLEEGFGALFRGASDEKPGPTPDVIRAICGVGAHTRRQCHGCSGSFEVDSVVDTALRLPLLSPAAQFDAELREKEEGQPITLQELMDASQQPETIEGYDCDKCRECSAEQGTEHVRSTITQHAGVISATRDILIVVLYRFGHALDAKGDFKPVKVKRQVACPSELTVDTGRYSLFGVVSHLGTSLSAGHYVSAVRSRRDDIWYECNDETVTPLNVKSLYDGRAVTAVRAGAEPYILFYHRKPADTAGESPVVMVTKEDLVAEVAAKAGAAAPPKEASAAEAADEAAEEATEGAMDTEVGADEAADASADATNPMDEAADSPADATGPTGGGSEAADATNPTESSSEDAPADATNPTEGSSREDLGAEDAAAAAPEPAAACDVDMDVATSDADADADADGWVVVPESPTAEALALEQASGSDQRGVRRRLADALDPVSKRSCSPEGSACWAKGRALQRPGSCPNGFQEGRALQRSGSCPNGFQEAVRRGFEMLSRVGSSEWTPQWTPKADTCTACSTEGIEFFIEHSQLSWP